MVFRILIIVFTILYQNIGFSKVNINSEFNQRYLSNYFSAMLSYNNYDNEKSLKFFNSSKFILNEHDKFLKQYLCADDIAIGMGAGSISNWIKELPNLMKK